MGAILRTDKGGPNPNHPNNAFSAKNISWWTNKRETKHQFYYLRTFCQLVQHHQQWLITRNLINRMRWTKIYKYKNGWIMGLRLWFYWTQKAFVTYSSAVQDISLSKRPKMYVYVWLNGDGFTFRRCSRSMKCANTYYNFRHLQMK